jgi:hypothetical protein
MMKKGDNAMTGRHILIVGLAIVGFGCGEEAIQELETPTLIGTWQLTLVDGKSLSKHFATLMTERPLRSFLEAFFQDISQVQGQADVKLSFISPGDVQLHVVVTFQAPGGQPERVSVFIQGDGNFSAAGSALTIISMETKITSDPPGIADDLERDLSPSRETFEYILDRTSLTIPGMTERRREILVFEKQKQ